MWAKEVREDGVLLVCSARHHLLVRYVRQVVVKLDGCNLDSAGDNLSPSVDREAHVLLENFRAAVVHLDRLSLMHNIDIVCGERVEDTISDPC